VDQPGRVVEVGADLADLVTQGDHVVEPAVGAAERTPGPGERASV
jgi:hypothetical protein